MIEKDIHTQMLFKEENTIALERGGARRCMGCMRICNYDDEKCPHCSYPKKPVTDLPLFSHSGKKLNNRYILGRLIHYDGYQATYLGYDEFSAQRVFLREYLPKNLCTRIADDKVIAFSEPCKSIYEFGLGKFLQESETYSGFHHNSIIQIQNVFEFENTAYAVATFEDGKMLSELIAENTNEIEYNDSLSIVLQIGEALSYLHDYAFIFLNVTPENIWITESGEAKLLWPGKAENELKTKVRSIDDGFGKKPYLAFEQYGNINICDSSTDVYSLAMVLWRLVFSAEPVDACKRYASIEKSGKDSLTFPPNCKSKIKGFALEALKNATQLSQKDRTPDIITFIGELLEDHKFKRRKSTIKKADSSKSEFRILITSGIACVAMVVVTLLSLAGIIVPKANVNIDYEIETGKVSVPNFLSSNYNEALKRANENGLILSIEYKAENPCVGKNIILSQHPSAMEKVGYGSIVHVVVSSGSGTDIVRNVKGFSVDSAREALEKLGFVVRIEEEKNSDYYRDVVFAQSVQAGVELEKGSEITLFISSGNSSILTSNEITIPNLIGKTYEEAKERLKETGAYVVIEKYDNNPKKEDGVIISQTPNAYSSERAGTVISVVINKSESGCYMPNVSYLPLHEAKKILDDNGLMWKLSYKEDDSVDKNVVTDQSISVGTFVQKGTVVTLTVNDQKTVEIADFYGKPYYSVKQELMKLGISSTLKNPDVSANEKSYVVWQSEPSGKRLSRGSEIILDISETE